MAATHPLIKGFEIEMLLYIQCAIEVGCGVTIIVKPGILMPQWYLTEGGLG